MRTTIMLAECGRWHMAEAVARGRVCWASLTLLIIAGDDQCPDGRSIDAMDHESSPRVGVASPADEMRYWFHDRCQIGIRLQPWTTDET